ncbi:hypothetical protein V5O48_001105 [Marasmius crinis-equi]|uniref:BOD1/SHG1 domain-containing protein n=1 Tax=Marasmius crinis-equi TaxID=585013 RepID=A0ABR3FZB5_9AGAR
MSKSSSTDIVAEFKKSGEYDRLRKDLLVQFQKSEGIEGFKSKIEENVRQLLLSDMRLRGAVMSGSAQGVHKTLVGEVERFPTLERAVSDHAMFSDPAFLANVRGFIERSLDEDKEKGSKPTAKESQSKTDLERKSNTEAKSTSPREERETQKNGPQPHPKSPNTDTPVEDNHLLDVVPPLRPTSRSSPESRAEPPASEPKAQMESGAKSGSISKSKGTDDADVVMQDADNTTSL